jgi:hypothetical protein
MLDKTTDSPARELRRRAPYPIVIIAALLGLPLFGLAVIVLANFFMLALAHVLPTNLAKVLGVALGILSTVIVLFALIGLFLFFGHEWEERKVRQLDEAKERLGGDTLPQLHADHFEIFLRPFDKEERFCHYAEHFSKRDLPIEVMDGERKKLGDFFDSFCRIARASSRLPMFMIGRREDWGNLGASTIQTPDATWKAVADSLMSRARRLYYVPDVSEGTLWEWERIVTSYLDKTIFLLPPAYEFREKYYSEREKRRGLFYDISVSDSRRRSLIEYWTIVTAQMNQFDLRIPAFDDCGCMFWFVDKELRCAPLPAFESSIDGMVWHHGRSAYKASNPATS